MAHQKKIDKILENLEPQERLKQLINYSNSVEVDPHVPPIRYYRSGIEMVRMANVYYEEGSLENSYVLYLKFMTLFLEKIRKHPGFNTVPIDIKGRNQTKLREILPKAEKLKQQLLEQYRDDYNRYLAELKEQRKYNGKRKKQEDKRQQQREELDTKRNEHEASTRSNRHGTSVIIHSPENIDDVYYPDSEPATPPPSATPSAESIIDIPTIDRTNKPSTLSFQERYEQVLRRVVVPMKVLTLFQTTAQTNTTKNIETCGVLTGKLSRNELIITHLIIPQQTGTSDSCAATNEEEIYMYQDQYNLITLGWIHTHPTQTAFLSSVDLHTHLPYQLLLPEAIAIVCAPKYNQTGVYHLTPQHGVPIISRCRKSGFHPHPNEHPLFTEAQHVRMDNRAPLEIVDLRKA